MAPRRDATRLRPCPPAPAPPDTLWTDPPPDVGHTGPRPDQGVNALGIPRFERLETKLTDTELPDAAPPFSRFLCRFKLARNETLHVVRVGQRLVVRRPGRVPAPHGLPTEYLAGWNILVTWDLVRVEEKVTETGAAAQGIVLVPESGTAQIWTPWHQPRPTHILVPGPCAVVLQVRVTGTSNVQDAIYELGGFVEAWRYLEGDFPRGLHFLATQAAR